MGQVTYIKDLLPYTGLFNSLQTGKSVHHRRLEGIGLKSDHGNFPFRAFYKTSEFKNQKGYFYLKS